MERRLRTNNTPSTESVDNTPVSSGKPNKKRGKGKKARDARRMASYNERKAEGSSWSNQVKVDEKAQDAFSEIRNSKTTFRPKSKDYKTVAETAPRDEILYEGMYSGGKPSVEQNSQNFEFSSFPLLCEQTYDALEKTDGRLRRRMPFCMYQHYMTEILNAYLIKHSKCENEDQRFAGEADPYRILEAEKLKIPQIFEEYLMGVQTNITPSGAKVLVNLPDAGIPQPKIATVVTNPSVENTSTDQFGPQLDGGSFGVITAENHNAYECYVSPFISRRLVERTREVNLAAHGDRDYGDWDPFPTGAFPTGGVANCNLLGYARPEVLAPEALNRINDLHFENEGMAGRLAHSSELMNRVSNILDDFSGRMKFVTGLPIGKVNSAAFITLRVQDTAPDIVRLSDISASLHSAYQFGSAAANKADFFGYRRERTPVARGLCFTVGGDAPPGWNSTINANYHMLASFGPTKGRDKPTLRERDFVESSTEGSRSTHLRQWINKCFIIERPLIR